MVSSVEADETVSAENTVTVYNFEVEDWHTYFVGEEVVLVHNTCPKTKAEILADNKNQGRDFEIEQFEIIKGEYPNAVEQVTIVTADGTRIRMDAVAIDGEGNILLFEFKSSKTATFTDNQTKAYVKNDFTLIGGGTVKGKKPALDGLFPKGASRTVPPGTKVDVKWP